MTIFLYGPDTFSSRKKLKEIKEKYLREVPHGHLNLLFFNGETASPQELQKVMTAPPMLARKRLVVMESILKNKNKKVASVVLECLARPSIQDVFVFWEEESQSKKKKGLKPITQETPNPLLKKLLAGDFSQAFPILAGQEIIRWIKKQGKDIGLIIDPLAQVSLAEESEGDLWRLNQELEKLVAYALARKKNIISADDVSALACHARPEENVFPLIDALAEKNFPVFLKIFNQQLAAGAGEVFLVSCLLALVRNLLQVSDLKKSDSSLTSAEMAQKLRLHPYVVRKALLNLKHFSFEELKKIHQALLQADVSLKSKRVYHPRLFIDLILGKLCSKDS